MSSSSEAWRRQGGNEVERQAGDGRAPDRLVETAIAHGRRHYSESGEPLATTLAVLECLQREGYVTVEAPGALNLARLALERIPSAPYQKKGTQFGLCI